MFGYLLYIFNILASINQDKISENHSLLYSEKENQISELHIKSKKNLKKKDLNVIKVSEIDEKYATDLVLKTLVKLDYMYLEIYLIASSNEKTIKSVIIGITKKFIFDLLVNLIIKHLENKKESSCKIFNKKNLLTDDFNKICYKFWKELEIEDIENELCNKYKHNLRNVISDYKSLNVVLIEIFNKKVKKNMKKVLLLLKSVEILG